MSTTNLSAYDANRVPHAGGMKFDIIVSDWNSEVTFALCEGAVETLKKHGTFDKDIRVFHVPGSFELVYNSLKVNLFVSQPTLEIVTFKDTGVKTKSNKHVYKCKLFGYVGNKEDDKSFYVTFELMLDQPELTYSSSDEPLVIEEKPTGYHTITFTVQK